MGTRVYIGDLPSNCGERELEKFIKGYGRIYSILIKEGHAFIEFEDYRDAEDAVFELNGKTILGEIVKVQIAGEPSHRNYGRIMDIYRDRYPPKKHNNWLDKYGPPTRTEYRLIVKNLSSRVSWQDLKDYMRQAGEVTYADAHKQRRNEGVVEFATYSDMKSALIKLNDTELNGRTLRLIEDKHRHSRRSRSRSYSRSRSRSRSRNYKDDRSRSRSPRYSRRHSKTPRKSRSRSASRSGSPQRLSPANDARKSRSRSHSISKSPEILYEGSRSPSKSPRADIQEDYE